MKKINFGKTVAENFEKIVADFDSNSVKSDGAAPKIFNRMEKPRNPRYDKDRHNQINQNIQNNKNLNMRLSSASTVMNVYKNSQTDKIIRTVSKNEFN